jgi:DNA ligase-1
MKTIERFNEFIDKLNANNGRIYKETILSEYKNDVEIKELLHFIFNPFIITGVSKKKAMKYKGKINIDRFDLFDLIEEPKDYTNLSKMLEYFKSHNTGRDEDLQELEKYAQHNAPYQELIYTIITKDLKLGVQATTLNKVFGEDFVPTFDVMLAQKYYDDPYKLLPDNTEFILTEKLDGVRCVFLNTINGKFFSRQGQTFEGLTELENECRHLPLGYVYDGELLLANSNNLESKDLYRETMKVVSADKEKTGVIFNIFDMLPIEDFYKGKSDIPAEKRKSMINEIFSELKMPHLKEVSILYQGNDRQAIEEHLDRITNAGGEGVMINIADAPYECKRTKGLLKVKKMQTADVKVIALEPGTGKNYNKLGALRVEFIGPDNKIYTCSVGSGLSDEDREKFWNAPELVCDKIIEVQYFEISSNQNGTYSLRFPVFKHIREDKTEISMY